MMSAEVPCIGALMAFLSARDLTVAFLELMSGRYLRRPKSVLTYPSSLAEAIVSEMYPDIEGKLAK